MLAELFTSLFEVLSLNTLGFVALGSLIGLVVGALPGLGGVIGMSLLLPLTYALEPVNAMFLYAGAMGGTPLGGSISAILINTPGTSVNAATCFDGYPMTQRGEAGRALGIASAASGLGALFGVIVLILLLPIVRMAILAFGPPEFFMFILFGLGTIVIASQRNMIKGVFAGGLGILFSFFGQSVVTGDIRYNLGTMYLWDGIQLIPFVIGVFALAEMIRLTVERKSTIVASKVSANIAKGTWEGVKDIFRHRTCFFRSSTIGTIIGIIPGVGGTAANFISYTIAMQSSKHPEAFGTGNPEGVIASESANNSKDGGALLPTLGFGIPGSAETAVLLGAFILFGISPGPLLFKDHPEIIWALVWGLVVSNVLASTFGLLAANILLKLSFVNLSIIIPVVTTLSLVGAFAIRGNIYDVFVAVIFGFLAYFLTRNGFPIVTMAIGYILGRLAEKSFLQSIMISKGNYLIFFTRPVSLAIFILLILVFLIPFLRRNKSTGDKT